MQDVVVRMRRVSEDLRVIRERLEELRVDHKADHQVIDEVLELDLISDFKGAVDQIRLFLWDYFQTAAIQSGLDHNRAIQQFRLRRAAEMLRSMQDQITIPGGPDPEITSLFERLQNLADVAVQRHFATKAGDQA